MEEALHTFYCVSAFLLFITFLLIWLIPSGPKCPDCDTYLTETLKLDAIRKSDDKQVKLEFTICFKCKKKFNLSINGKKVDSFKELDAEEV